MAGREALSRWRARVVTYGLVVVLAGAVWTQTEAWPVTSYRLFSAVRTGTSASLELVAVGADGEPRPVRVTGGAVAGTRHQYRELPGLPEAERRERVEAWLRVAGVDPATLVEVRLERVIRALDPEGGPSRVTGRVVIVAVPLGVDGRAGS